MIYPNLYLKIDEGFRIFGEAEKAVFAISALPTGQLTPSDALVLSIAPFLSISPAISSAPVLPRALQDLSEGSPECARLEKT